MNILDKDFQISVLNILRELKETMDKELGIGGNYLNIVKAIYVKLIVNNTFNGKRLNIFSLRLGTR